MRIRGLLTVAVLLAGCGAQVTGTALPDSCGAWESALRDFEESPEDTAVLNRIHQIANEAPDDLARVMQAGAGASNVISETPIDRTAGAAAIVALWDVQDACAATGRTIVYPQAFQRD